MVKKGRTRLKICGITNKEDAIMVANLGADALGFVFAESKRKITPEKAKEITEILPPFITTVGIFLDTDLQEVNEICEYTSLDAVQLHGNETPEYCDKIKRKVIKGISINASDTKESLLSKMKDYSVSAFILDPGRGSGKVFEWKIAKGIKKPIIIAGGLTPDNVKQVIKDLHPYGVDVSTGVEKGYGKKDRKKVEKFIKEALSC
ncbi:MAG: phosphoribosylanthranilate isomerase [candidate division WOR-3 bacterium]|jgi:phosphoribosylanthranilate isomerase